MNVSGLNSVFDFTFHFVLKVDTLEYYSFVICLYTFCYGSFSMSFLALFDV
jgi:hypothetical protein